jgi:hypothetical protein
MKLSDLKYLNYLKDVKTLVIIFLVLFAVYFIVKSPKIELNTKIQFEQPIDTIKTDSSTLNIE